MVSSPVHSVQRATDVIPALPRRRQRSKKALTGAETIVYLYDLQGQLIAEYIDGSLKREYVWLAGAPLAQIDATAGGDSITWFTTDHLHTKYENTGNVNSTNSSTGR